MLMRIKILSTHKDKFHPGNLVFDPCVDGVSGEVAERQDKDGKRKGRSGWQLICTERIMF